MIFILWIEINVIITLLLIWVKGHVDVKAMMMTS